jgi:hypothetical protein
MVLRRPSTVVLIVACVLWLFPSASWAQSTNGKCKSSVFLFSCDPKTLFNGHGLDLLGDVLTGFEWGLSNNSLALRINAKGGEVKFRPAAFIQYWFLGGMFGLSLFLTAAPYEASEPIVVGTGGAEFTYEMKNVRRFPLGGGVSLAWDLLFVGLARDSLYNGDGIDTRIYNPDIPRNQDVSSTYVLFVSISPVSILRNLGKGVGP